MSWAVGKGLELLQRAWGRNHCLLTHRLPGYCEPSEMREEEGLQERGGAFAPPAGRPLFLEAVGVLYNLLTSC